jgi:hypothetical protein
VETLFDYLTHTKTVGYVVAGLCLIGFVPFWKFLTEREKDEGPRTRGVR